MRPSAPGKTFSTLCATTNSMTDTLADSLTLPPLLDLTVDVIGVGSPLVDLILRVDDAFLSEHVPGHKGGMEFIEADHIAELIQIAGRMPHQAPGGSAANITVGMARLGIGAAFVGSAGTDELGGYYAESLVESRVQPRLVDHRLLPTGRVLALVTPDGERTMRTCLGAAAALDPASLAPATFSGAKLVVVEGYSLFNHELARAIVRTAREAGCQVALDLAAFEVIQANREVIEELFTMGIDVVFANQDEALIWHPDGVEAALDDLASKATVAVVKLGKEGVLVASGDERVRVAGTAVNRPVDTIGAGDCFASGFLASWLRGLSLEICGTMGCACGSAIVQVEGAQLPAATWFNLRGRLDAWS
jgi:sugar/nucleoside kinase (ribokinase family)